MYQEDLYRLPFHIYRQTETNCYRIITTGSLSVIRLCCYGAQGAVVKQLWSCSKVEFSFGLSLSHFGSQCLLHL